MSDQSPILVQDETNPSDIIAEMEVRLAALLEAYGCDASPEGWRSLAIRLALKHEPALAIVTPFDREPGKGGRRAGIKNFIWRSAMRQARSRGAKTGTEAARMVQRKFPEARKLAPKTLINIESGSGKTSFGRADYELTAEIAAEAAAASLQKSHKPVAIHGMS